MRPRSQFHIHVTVSDLCIPRICPHIFPCSRIGRPIPEIYINLSPINECRNWETEHYDSVLEITLYFWEYINENQTFILDSHRPFICSAGSTVSSHLTFWPPLQRHNTEDSKQIFPEKELRGHSLNFHIHVSLRDLYNPRIGLPILLQENMWTDLGNI